MENKAIEVLHFYLYYLSYKCKTILNEHNQLGTITNT